MRDTKDCWLKENCKCLHCNDEAGCLILFKMDYLYNEAHISDRQRKYIDLHIDSDGTDYNEFIKLKKIQDNVEDFVNDGGQLYLHSPYTGNGKTSWALRIIQTYFKKIWLKTELKCRGLFVNVSAYLTAMKANISERNEYYQHIKDNLLDADIVIWDDIGTKAASQFEHEALYSAINTRIDMGKCNIFTSNLTDEELKEVLGDRLASRICRASINIQLLGGDKRSFSVLK